MRNLIVLLLLGVTVIAYSQTPHQPFTITLSSGKPEVKAGDRVHVDILMTNTSNQDVNCTIDAHGGLDMNYGYKVVDADGRTLPEIPRNHPLPGSIYPCTLKPGESRSLPSSISTLYDLTHPGKYTIQVTRGYEGSDELVSSNTLTITVIAPDSPSPSPK